MVANFLNFRIASFTSNCLRVNLACSPMYCEHINITSFKWEWENGNNLTSYLFILITSLITHKNTSDICSYELNIDKNKVIEMKEYIKK